MSAENKICILYIDDEVNNLIAFKANFRRIYEVYTAVSAEEGLLVLQEKKINIVLSDQRMPRMTGSEFLASILPDYPDPIRILLTGYADIDAIIDAINKARIFAYITKPWNEEELRTTIEKAFAQYLFNQEHKNLTRQLEAANRQLEIERGQKQ